MQDLKIGLSGCDDFQKAIEIPITLSLHYKQFFPSPFIQMSTETIKPWFKKYKPVNEWQYLKVKM